MKFRLKWLLITLFVLAILSPIGLLASGTAFGEWELDELKDKLGFVPAGFAKLRGMYSALLPDYGIRGWGGLFKSSVGYVISALVGMVLIGGITVVVAKIVARGDTNKQTANGK